MRAQLTIAHMPLSPAMSVMYVDNGERTPTVEEFFIDREDAEYQLLAQAIDRFVRVQRITKEKAAEVTA